MVIHASIANHYDSASYCTKRKHLPQNVQNQRLKDESSDQGRDVSFDL
jgi:hypothetical protein